MRYLSLTFLILVGLNIFIWGSAVSAFADEDVSKTYFLDVGQGDSQLVVLPGGVKILIDGGSNKEASFQLGNILSPMDRYIDLLVVTHAQKDHFGGFLDIASRYQIGAVLWNGEAGVGEEWEEFVGVLDKKDVKSVILEKGDRILYEDSVISVLSPDEESLREPDANEGSLVLLIESEGARSLFTGDIGVGTENRLLEEDIDIDVLKVAHHGSRFSTGTSFLERTTPEVSVIGVGNNNYGHPHPSVIQRLQLIRSSVYRTDEDGTIEITSKDGVLGIKTGL